MAETKNEKPQEPDFIKDQDLPDVVEQYRLGDNIRDENGNIIYNSDVIKYLQSIFGDGSDGDVSIDTIDTNLITDMFYNNLNVASPFTLYTSGYRIFVKNKLTINTGAKIARNGVNGVDGGSALTSGSLYGALAGGAGGPGGAGRNGAGTPTAGTAGTAGVDLAKCLGSNAVAGGAGGAGGTDLPPSHGGGASGGAGGAAGSKTGTVYNNPRGLTSAYMLYDSLPAGDVLKTNPSAGGGGGGGGADSQAEGGGGNGGLGGTSGSGGGIVEIFAKNLVNNGIISANGGNGGNGLVGGNGGGAYPAGGGGGGAGGSGGNGGILILCYINKSGTGTETVTLGAKGSGGAGGTGVNGGTNGSTGSDGNDGVAGSIIELKV